MLESLLKATVDSGASDLHLTVGRPATVRRDGVLISFENVPVLASDEIDRMVYSLLDERKVEELHRDRQVDFSFGLAGIGRFRANAFRQRGNLALAPNVLAGWSNKLDNVHPSILVPHLIWNAEEITIRRP